MELRKLFVAILSLMTCDQPSKPPPQFMQRERKEQPELSIASASSLPAAAVEVKPPPEEKTVPIVPSGKKILIAGDSLAVGLSPELQRLMKINDYTAASHAVVGSTTAQWLQWIKADLAVHKPALVVVSLGTNDAAAAPAWIENNKGNFAEFVKVVTASGAKLVWIGPPEFDVKLLPRVPYVRDLIIEAAPIFYDSRKFDLPRGEDRIHSTVNGYKAWANDVWGWMSKNNVVAVK